MCIVGVTIAITYVCWTKIVKTAHKHYRTDIFYPNIRPQSTRHH